MRNLEQELHQELRLAQEARERREKLTLLHLLLVGAVSAAFVVAVDDLGGQGFPL